VFVALIARTRWVIGETESAVSSALSKFRADQLQEGEITMGQTYQSILISAPVEKVWDAISDFHDVSWCSNVLTKLDKIGDKSGREVGAGRILNDAFHETLLEVNAAERMFRYSIDDGPPPISKSDVQNYVGKVVVRPVTEGSGTFVEWSSQWQNNDQPAQEFCHPIYVAILTDMKKSLE
jgi:hypothetical protein